MRIVLMTAGLLLLLLLAACGDSGGSGPGDARRVVATTPQLADFARQVGGGALEVKTLLPPNVDPHDYEPRPSDARAIAEADVVLRSGGEVDEWLAELLDAAGSDADVVVVADEIGARGEDPHWWQDPRNAARAAYVVAERVGGDARAYVRRIEALDREIATCMRSIPRERRKLVTNHDAFGWFARRYDIEVLGSIIPGGSTSAQPSARDVRELAAAIRRERVRTIFPDSALDRKLEAAVARDAGAQVGEPLYADTLGDAGTYLGALRHDAAAMARGFGGACHL
jgi:ABC-type Zn uptake system ZnuABC Zn-binding protein ZnuA